MRLSFDSRPNQLDHSRVFQVALLVAASMLLWIPIESLGARAGVSPYQVVWTRYGTHLIAMLLVFGPRHGRGLVVTRRLRPMILRSLCMLGMPICFILAAARMPLSDLFGIFWISPLIAIGLSTFCLEGRPGLRPWIAGFCGAVGAILFTGVYKGQVTWGWPPALGMSGCFAAYVVLTYEVRQEPVLTRLFHSALWVFLSLSLVVPLIWRRPSLAGLASMVAIGLLGWVLLFSLDLALDLAPPSVVAPFLYMNLIWTAVVDRTTRHSTFGPVAVAGLGLLILSMLIVIPRLPLTTET